MPTYEYACADCGQHMEVVHGFKDKPPRKCAACGGKLNKVFHPVGIVLKGSGFYRTDSRASAKTSGKPEKNAERAKSDSGAGKSDAAPAKSDNAKSAEKSA